MHAWRERLSLRTLLTAAVLLLAAATWLALRPLPAQLPDREDAGRVQFLDRQGNALSATLSDDWNYAQRLPLSQIPLLLQQAVVTAEDQRFFAHRGVDWRARAHAAWQNLRALRVLRGASTLSEQTVRLLHPRPRNLWSRWLEGWEAAALEARFSKPDILEFYLNQVPYAAQRRGVLQASRYYFGRDLDTLNTHEMLTLAVLIRSPHGMAPGRADKRLRSAVKTLAARMAANGELAHLQTQQTVQTVQAVLAEPLSRPLGAGDALAVADVSHVVRALRAWPGVNANRSGNVSTTLDAALQRDVAQALATGLRLDAGLNVRHAAALVADWQRNEIVAWSVLSADGTPATQIDAIRAPRQPGSTLKPLVYAAAFEAGWTPSTMILDAPLEQLVGLGMHEYRNYSRVHYGWISAREALGNSLNVPAVKAFQFAGSARFLALARQSGIHSLNKHPNQYGDGIALGNGEVSLYELVEAYATLARGGVYLPLSPFPAAQQTQADAVPAMRAETAALIADILADPQARAREFGAESVLAFPLRTAVKTGTSSDYRDAWTLAFNDRYVVGVWFGNLDAEAMHEISGARGPAPVTRAIVNALNRFRDTHAMASNANLQQQRVCLDTGMPADAGCAARDEWFAPWMQPGAFPDGDSRVRIRKPGPGLLLAMDPRIPDSSEAFEFLLQAPEKVQRVEWLVDGVLAGKSNGERFVWPLVRGRHRVQARVWVGEEAAVVTEEIGFLVR